MSGRYRQTWASALVGALLRSVLWSRALASGDAYSSACANAQDLLYIEKADGSAVELGPVHRTTRWPLTTLT
jgi:hypothetical protein